MQTKIPKELSKHAATYDKNQSNIKHVTAYENQQSQKAE
jgi:hypothetical protein